MLLLKKENRILENREMKKLLKFITKPIQLFFLRQKSKRLHNSISALSNFEPINYLDIGAAGSIGNRWNSISKAINYVGFEPHAESRKKLLGSNPDFNHYRILDNAVGGDNHENTFHICTKSDTSSLLPPNDDLLSLYPEHERYKVIKREKIITSKLDDLDLGKIDFMKLDIQGMELEALRGGETLLENCLGVESEVEFVPLYTGACTFSDLSSYLKSKDFIFIDFIKIIRWGRDDISSNLGQCIWADALFLRSPEYISSLKDQIILEKYIVICLMYNKFDLIDSLISTSLNEERELEFLINTIKPLRKRAKYLNKLKKLLNFVYRNLDSNAKLHFLN